MSRSTHTPAYEPGKTLARAALVMCLFVIMLGAFTRLTDAGLGCPDWPGCYGRIVVPQSAEHVAQANAAYPARPVDHAKAWAEMVHRYLAGSLGLLVFFLCALHWRAKTRHRGLLTGLSVFIIAQAALGMWTVTLGLKPVVVTAHLLGGFTTFSLLLLLNLRQSHWLLALRMGSAKTAGTVSDFASNTHSNNSARNTVASEAGQENAPTSPKLFRATNPLFLTTLVVLILQITLGGWTAANYAATVCTDLPICQEGWQSHLNFEQAFKLWWHDVEPYRDGTSAYEFGTHITPDVKITIHALHRIGAWTATVLILLCAIQLWRFNRLLALNLLFLLAAQVLLGISNVVLNIPLAVAVAHNLGGLLLLAWMIVIFKWSKQHVRLHAQQHAIGYRTHDARNTQSNVDQNTPLTQPTAP